MDQSPSKNSQVDVPNPSVVRPQYSTVPVRYRRPMVAVAILIATVAVATGLWNLGAMRMSVWQDQAAEAANRVGLVVTIASGLILAVLAIIAFVLWEILLKLDERNQ